MRGSTFCSPTYRLQLTFESFSPRSDKGQFLEVASEVVEPRGLMGLLIGLFH